MKRKISLIMAIIMSMTLLAGCDGSYAGVKLGKAIIASYDIKSAETTFDMKMKISATGLSAEDKTSFDQAMASVGDVAMSGKLIQTISDDRLKNKASGTMEVSGGGVTYKNINLWLDSDFTGENKKFIEVVQLPPALTAMQEKLAGKDYIVMDLGAMMPGNMPNQADMMKSSMQMNENMKKLISAMITDFKPGVDFVSETGIEFLPDGLKATKYRLSLDDKKLKKLLRADVDYLSTSPLFETMMKGYVESLPTMSEAQKNFKTGADKALDEFEKYKVFGPKGITIDFTIDEKGNIRKENIEIDIALDLNQLSTGKSQGVVSVAISMNVDLNRVNEPMEINMPVLTSANSISYADLMKQPLRYFPVNSDKKVISKVNYYKLKSVISEINGAGYSVKKDTVSFKVDNKVYKIKLNTNYIMENGKKINVSGIVLKKVKGTIYISEKAIKALEVVLIRY